MSQLPHEKRLIAASRLPYIQSSQVVPLAYTRYRLKTLLGQGQYERFEDLGRATAEDLVKGVLFGLSGTQERV
jgi:hypothetical protein